MGIEKFQNDETKEVSQNVSSFEKIRQKVIKLNNEEYKGRTYNVGIRSSLGIPIPYVGVKNEKIKKQPKQSQNITEAERILKEDVTLDEDVTLEEDVTLKNGEILKKGEVVNLRSILNIMENGETLTVKIGEEKIKLMKGVGVTPNGGASVGVGISKMEDEGVTPGKSVNRSVGVGYGRMSKKEKERFESDKQEMNQIISDLRDLYGLNQLISDLRDLYLHGPGPDVNEENGNLVISFAPNVQIICNGEKAILQRDGKAEQEFKLKTPQEIIGGKMINAQKATEGHDKSQEIDGENADQELKEALENI